MILGLVQRSAAVALCAISLSACGQIGQSWVKGASLSSVNQNGEQIAQLGLQLVTGALGLPSIQLPIFSSSNPLSPIGQVGIQPGLGGQSSLVAQINMSRLLKLPAGGQVATLPNGTSLPIADALSGQTVALPVGNSGSKLYFNINSVQKTAFMGLALVIPQFTLGVPANLLFPFASGGLNGNVGIFTGQSAGQSGFAAFIDASSLFGSALPGSVAPLNLAAGPSLKRANLARLPAGSTPQGAVRFPAVQPDNRTYSAMQSMVYYLNKHRAQLTVQ